MMQSGPDVGTQIRSRRKQQGLTLEGLAQRSGVSTAMLSEVERSVKNPTVKLAWQIARALGCSLTALLDEPGAPTTLVRAADRRTLIDPDTGVQRHGVSSTLLSGGLEVATYVLPVGASSGAMPANRAGVAEHVLVVRGNLGLRIGDAETVLGPGDHITYGPQAVVEYLNRGASDTEFVLLSDSSSLQGRPA
jgi:transcriptional regulator with XRE-family HTH domain